MAARGVSFRFGAEDEVTDTAKNSPHDQSPEQSGKLLHFFKGNKVTHAPSWTHAHLVISWTPGHIIPLSHRWHTRKTSTPLL